jgi:K+-sensing histidine kinase KdpD
VLHVLHDRSTGFEPQRERISASDPRLPDAFVGMVAFGATLAVAVALARAGTAVGWGTQLAVMSVTVALLSWWSRVLPSVFVSVIGWLMLNGIVVNGAGRLGWDGHQDVIRVGVLLGAGLAAALARTLELQLRSLPTRSPAVEADRHLYVVQSDKERLGDRHA